MSLRELHMGINYDNIYVLPSYREAINNLPVYNIIMGSQFSFYQITGNLSLSICSTSGESKMKKALIIVLIIMCIIVLSILIAPMFLISFG